MCKFKVESLMKKLFFYCFILIVSLVCLTSCETVAVAAEVPVDTEVIYYDSGNNLVVVYIDGIANYRYWDDVYYRYYYRPVPHSRYHYIHRYSGPHHRHHHHATPGHHSHHGVNPGHPGGRNDSGRQVHP